MKFRFTSILWIGYNSYIIDGACLKTYRSVPANIFWYKFIVAPSDDVMSLTQYNDSEGILTLQDQRAEGSNIVILKFTLNRSEQLENYSIKINYYPSATEITDGNLLNIYGYSPTHDEVAFIRVSISSLTNIDWFKLSNYSMSPDFISKLCRKAYD